MKRLLFLLLLALTVSSLGYSQNMIGFGVQADYANLNVPEPLKSAYGSGFGGGLHLDFRFGVATIRVNGDYITFGADQDAYRDAIFIGAGGEAAGVVRTDINMEGGRINILSFGANGKFSLPHMAVSPYAIVGVGSATLSMGDVTVTYRGAPVPGITATETTTKFMLNTGAGVDFSLGAAALFVEAKYTWIFTEGDKSTYFPVTVGITF